MKDCLAVVGVEDEVHVEDVLDGSAVKVETTSRCGSTVKVQDGHVGI